MKVGLQVPNFTYPRGQGQLGAEFGRIAERAERAGLYSLWVMDHFFQIGGGNHPSGLGPAEDEMLEGYSALAYLAGFTKKVKLGTMVTGVIYRHPGILIKTVTTLDVLSGGRAYLGIGAAWNEREALALGVPFPPVAERFDKWQKVAADARVDMEVDVAFCSDRRHLRDGVNHSQDQAWRRADQ